MEITIRVPQKVQDLFAAEFEEAKGRKPLIWEMHDFFEQDVSTVYREVSMREGFVDAF